MCLELNLLVSGILDDLRSILPPAKIILQPTGIRQLVYVYDWDTISAVDLSLSFELRLCTIIWPCSLDLGGYAGIGALHVSELGAITCLFSQGCISITVDSVTVTCLGRGNNTSLFKMQQSSLQITNSKFHSCQSNTDGGVIQSYYKGVVALESCEFRHGHSEGYGGAIAAFGSDLLISNSTFSNFSSRKGGGAVWWSSFQDCYGSSDKYDTKLYIESSRFDKCSTEGSGGAVLVDSAMLSFLEETQSVIIAFSTFSDCFADENGGAIRLAGGPVAARVVSSKFFGCTSMASGGCISAEDLSSLSLISSSVDNGTSYGLGGGGVHLRNASFMSFNTIISNCSAPLGGGGGIFWQISVFLEVRGCPRGMRGVATSCALDLPTKTLGSKSLSSVCTFGTCAFCNAGEFQADPDHAECPGPLCARTGSGVCNVCEAGTYSTAQGKLNQLL